LVVVVGKWVKPKV